MPLHEDMADRQADAENNRNLPGYEYFKKTQGLKILSPCSAIHPINKTGGKKQKSSARSAELFGISIKTIVYYYHSSSGL